MVLSRLRIVGAWVLAWALLPGAAPCLAAAAVGDAELEAAIDLGARDPAASHAALNALRERAVAAGQTLHRLTIDEADCRVLNESDSEQARRVAEAGLAAAGPPPDAPAPLQVAAWRLGVCAAATLLDVGRTDEGDAALERIIAAARRVPDAKAAEAMALLERGLNRSRRGDLLSSQADLLGACATFEALHLPRDAELCHWHLGKHYQRMGDVDEALRLFEPLLESARRRRATADMSIYLLGIAQARFEEQAWEPALRAYRESNALAESLGDASGIAYAEYGIAYTLLRLGRAAESLPHVERSMSLLSDGSDAVQGARTLLLHATLLVALNRPAEALAELEAGRSAMDRLRDSLLAAEWLRTRASAEAKLGRWQAAYGSLEAASELQQKAHEQRLSRQQARLRMQFNREKDAAELLALRRVNEQGERLQRLQALAIALAVALLGAAIWVATQKLRESRRLRRLAMVDELTGLPNRRAVVERLDEQARHARRVGRPLSMLVVDIDHFKRINDTHGHAVGDEVLRHVARLLAEGLRANDAIGRVGGEEFFVVLPETDGAAAHRIAERMRQRVVQAPCPSPAAGSVACSISIGVSVLRRAAETPEQLVERADAALYAAKAGGRDRVCMAPDLEPQPA